MSHEPDIDIEITLVVRVSQEPTSDKLAIAIALDELDLAGHGLTVGHIDWSHVTGCRCDDCEGQHVSAFDVDREADL